MNIKKSVFSKHLTRQSVNLTRGVLSKFEGNRVIVNSIPKSGTHLIHSILCGLGFRDFQGFFATTQPLSMMPKSDNAAIDAINSILPGEIFCSHIFHSEQVAEKVATSSTPMIFIKRDPRAVFVSELYYLTQMKILHRYSMHMAKCRNENAVFEMLLNGDPNVSFFFPNFAERIAVYEGWQSSRNVLSLKFEELTSKDNISCVHSIIKFLESQHEQSGMPCGIEPWRGIELDTVMRNLRPENSHTFTGLDPDRWRTQLTSNQISRLECVLGDVIGRLGYS